MARQVCPGNGVLLIFCLITSTWRIECDAVSVDGNFNMNGVIGFVSFSQQSPANPTEIKVSLSGLDQYPSETFPWHIHNYPFTTQKRDPCSAASVGGHFNPFMANSSAQNYSAMCSNNRSFCQVGDLSGKLGRLNASSSVTVSFTDDNLPLYGVHSIVGRSVVIHRSNGDRWVCANIEYPGNVTVAYSPFRANLIGSIFFIGPYSPMNLTTVFVRLSYVSGSLSSSSHKWHVFNNSINKYSNCIDAGEHHYNPKNISTGSEDYQYCNSYNQGVCEVGDLSGKSSPLNFINGHSVFFYVDINLPVRINRFNETILGRSVVIHSKMSNPARIACANLLEYSPKIASAKFQEDGVTGQVVFKQSSPFSPTVVRITLYGLLSRASGYQVHEFPVDETIPGSSKCTAAGGYYNPRNITRNSSSPTTYDAYEMGDLSGKSSQTLNRFYIADFIYTDPYLPLFGTESIVGRSVIVHYPNGDRWLCANILYDMETVSITAGITTDAFQGMLVLTQLANDPFSETLIFFNVNILPDSSSTSNSSTMDLASGLMPNTSTSSPPPTDEPDGRKKKYVFKRQVGAPVMYLSVQDSCESNASVVNPYSAPTSCSPDNQLACPVGDLTGKHGPLSLGRNLLTDLNLPLTGPNSIVGKAVVVRIGEVDSSMVECMSLSSYVTPSMSTSTIIAATSTTSTTSNTVDTTIDNTLAISFISDSTAIITEITSAQTVTTSNASVVSSPTSSEQGTPKSQGNDSGKNSTAVIGIVCGIGGIVLFLFVAIIVYCYVKRCHRRSHSPEFVNRDRGEGYEPLQLELAKKDRSRAKKRKRSEEYVEL